MQSRHLPAPHQHQRPHIPPIYILNIRCISLRGQLNSSMPFQGRLLGIQSSRRRRYSRGNFGYASRRVYLERVGAAAATLNIRRINNLVIDSAIREHLVRMMRNLGAHWS